jgi:cell wall-associated NlpC family hydrolase
MRYLIIIIFLMCFGVLCTPPDHLRKNRFVFYDDRRDEIVSTAEELLGVEYKNGGASPSGFDCSGFTRYVYEKNGYKIPRNAASQYYSGRRVSLKFAKPGDLVFFAISGPRVSHVGIYAGNYSFIHSASLGKTVMNSSMKTGYWEKRYVGAATYFSDSAQE